MFLCQIPDTVFRWQTVAARHLLGRSKHPAAPGGILGFWLPSAGGSGLGAACLQTLGKSVSTAGLYRQPWLSQLLEIMLGTHLSMPCPPGTQTVVLFTPTAVVGLHNSTSFIVRGDRTM